MFYIFCIFCIFCAVTGAWFDKSAAPACGGRGLLDKTLNAEFKPLRTFRRPFSELLRMTLGPPISRFFRFVIDFC